MYAFFPLYNLWNTVMLGQLSFSCRSLEQLPNFILTLSIPLRVPLMWSLWLVSLPLRHCHSWHHNHFIYFKSLPHRVPLAAHLDSLAWWTMSTFPWSVKPSTTPFMFDLEFNSSIITSFLCWTFIFVVQFLLSIIHFCKMSLKFSLGNKKVTRLQALLPAGDLSDRCTVTSHWWASKEVKRLVTDQNAHLRFIQWSKDFRASSEVCTLCNYSLLLGNWFCLTELW